MTDRPILFSAPMVRALLDGTKTQTRRVAKFITEDAAGDFSAKTSFGGVIGMSEHAVAFHAAYFSPWQIGDRLWVRETWRATERWDGHAPSKIPVGYMPIEYLATPAPPREMGKTRAKIHMPRWASRLTLTVTDVRVERLQDISAADAIAEGIESDEDYWLDYIYPTIRKFVDPRDSYRSLWDSINGDGAWEQNPWVVALTFDVRKGNIDG